MEQLWEKTLRGEHLCGALACPLLRKIFEYLCYFAYSITNVLIFTILVNQ